MAQAAHGSAPDIAGRDIANPVSLILSAGLLLDWHGRRRNMPQFNAAARAVEDVTAAAVATGEATADVGGKLGTRATGEAFARRLLALA
jgi:3-isopropylmalate dehydrogenase